MNFRSKFLVPSVYNPNSMAHKFGEVWRPIYGLEANTQGAGMGHIIKLMILTVRFKEYMWNLVAQWPISLFSAAHEE